MLKNNKAVTLLVLVVTVIVILVLGGTTIVTSDALIKKTKKKTIITNMYLIKGEVESIYEEYQFNGDENILKGTVLDENELEDVVSIYKAKTGVGDLWYEWNRDTLLKLGFDPEMLPNESEGYYVNYATGEIIYTPGVKEGTTRIYTLTKLTAPSSDEIEDEGF